MTYDEMKQRVQRLEVLHSQIKELDKIQQKTLDRIELIHAEDNVWITPGWVSDTDGFKRMVTAVKEVALELSEEIRVEIAKLEED